MSIYASYLFHAGLNCNSDNDQQKQNVCKHIITVTVNYPTGVHLYLVNNCS